MRTVLYASSSVNGFIGQADASHEIPSDVLADFHSHVRGAGNVVVGRQTFALLRSSGAGEAFAGIDVVVLSATLAETPGVIVARSPEEALERLTAEGHQTALIAGGARTYSSFLEQGLVDELYVNTTPFLSGGGPTMSSSEGTTTPLTLVDVTRLGEQIVQLHYGVEH